MFKKTLGSNQTGQNLTRIDIQQFTGYYAYGFRQYDSQLGRWHVIDKLTEWDFSTSGYAYVGGNPVVYYDVLGLWGGPKGAATKL